MSLKRTLREEESFPMSFTQNTSKRTRLSPNADVTSNSSASALASPSHASPLSSGSDHAADSSRSSMHSMPENSPEALDSSSENASSSESVSSSSPELDSEQEERGLAHEDETERIDLTTLPKPSKPNIDRHHIMGEASKLHEKLKYFLPQLEAANSDLLKESESSRTIEDVDEGEEHIEMNLGLGVLEEKRDSSDDEDEEEDSTDDEAEHVDVMQKLLGKDTQGRPVGIQELGEANTTQLAEER